MTPGSEARPSMAGPADEELLRRLRGGDEDAFVTLYRRRHGGIYRFALRVSGSKAAAEDVAQEVFMSLMNGGGQFDPARGSFSAYLFGIARHQLFRRMEQDRNFFAASCEGETTDSRVAEVPAHADPVGNLEREELIDSLRRAIATLPLHYREVVVLCDLEELTYGEAAQVIRCPEGTVRSRLNRARAMLLDKLQETKGQGPSRAQVRTARCFT